MGSASAWRPRAAARSWRDGAPRAASGCRRDASGGGGQAMARARAEPAKTATPGLRTLKRRAEFLRVRKGARWATAAFVLEAKPRGGEAGRAQAMRAGLASASPSRARSARRWSATASGVASRRRFAKSAADHAKGEFDYVLIARRPALTSDFGALRSDLVNGIRARASARAPARRAVRRDGKRIYDRASRGPCTRTRTTRRICSWPSSSRWRCCWGGRCSMPAPS